jgi:hypothetical protein
MNGNVDEACRAADRELSQHCVISASDAPVGERRGAPAQLLRRRSKIPRVRGIFIAGELHLPGRDAA